MKLCSTLLADGRRIYFQLLIYSGEKFPTLSAALRSSSAHTQGTSFSFSLDTKLISCHIFMLLRSSSRCINFHQSEITWLAGKCCYKLCAAKQRRQARHILCIWTLLIPLCLSYASESGSKIISPRNERTPNSGEVFEKKALNHEWNFVKRRKEFLSVTQFLLLL